MKEQIIYCHHCGNKTSHSVLYSTSSVGEGYNTNNPLETIKIQGYYYLTRCKTCEDISLYYDCEFDEDIGNLSDAVVFYPPIKKPGQEVPKLISETYYEALRVEKVSSIAFSILVHRALELVCKDKMATGRNLKSNWKI